MIPLLLSALVLSAWFSVPAHPQDVAGATDHLMLTRYLMSIIKWRDVQTFMPYKVAVGTVGGYRNIDDWVETKGKVTRLSYELLGERTHADVYANYKKALIDAGFTLMADGFHAHASVSPEIGTRKWLTIFYASTRSRPAPASSHYMDGDTGERRRLLHGSTKQC